MEVEDVYYNKDKHQSILLRKKFKHTNRYICCLAPQGNSTKFSKRYCCTFPQVYKRHDVRLDALQECRISNIE